MYLAAHVVAMLLVTGHEPPPGFDANPGATLARRLSGETVGGHTVASTVLPHDPVAAGDAIVDIVEEHGPDAVVGAGFDPGAREVAVERMGFSVGDWLAAGDDDAVDDAEGPVGYFATAPAETIVERLLARDIPARLSTAAATAQCDHLLYRALGHVAGSATGVDPATAVGYVHLPCTPEQAVHRADGGGEMLPSMAAETQLEGLLTALQSTAGAL